MAHDETHWEDGETRLTTTSGGGAAKASAVVPALTIAAHPDARRIGERIALPVLALGRPVRLARLEPDFRPPRGAAEGRPLAERSVSRQPIRLQGGDAPGGVRIDVRETRTPVTADGEAVETRRELAAAEIERGVVLKLGRHVVLVLHRLSLPIPENVPRFGLVGESDGVIRLCRELERLGPLDVPLLLRGESGTGKELAARALHDGGKRSGGPFVAVNMATLSPSLAAAELFGAERGAFTGADRKKAGLFQSAEGGTLFLDEIGETPMEVQAMLLRALESGEVLPVGSVEARPVDVRVIAATDARLEEAIAEGRFRAPLYHRLAGYAVELPALRARRDDIGRLLRHFLDQEPSPWPSAKIVARLVRHDWPGNVRELQNVARRLAIGHGDDEEHLLRGVEELLVRAAPRPASHPPTTTAPPRKRRRASDLRDDEVIAALRAHRWSVRDAAEALGISRAALYKRIEKSPEARKASELTLEEITACLERCGGDLDAMVDGLRVSKPALRRRMRQLGLE